MNYQPQSQFTTETTPNINSIDTVPTVLYARLSVEDKLKGDSNSIINQKKIMENYCQEHGIANTTFLYDDGISGTTENRQGYQNMIRLVETGEVKRVIFKNLDRLSRDNATLLNLYYKFFPSYDVEVIFIEDGINSSHPKENDSIFISMKSMFAEFYATQTSKKIRSTMEMRSKREHLCNAPIYGYKKAADNRKLWVIDEESAEIVKTIYQMFLTGSSIVEIRDKLMNEKVYSPNYYKQVHNLVSSGCKSSQPYRWSTTSISTILDNALQYAGHTVNRKTLRKGNKDRKRVANDESNYVILRNTQEPIITEEMALAVKNRRNGTRRKRTKLNYKPKFSGLIYCGSCGKPMSFSGSNRGYSQYSYNCRSYRTDTKACTSHYIREVVLEKIVMENMNNLFTYARDHEKEFLDMLIEEDQKATVKEASKMKKEIEKMKMRSSEIDKIIQRLYEDRVSMKVSEERYIKLAQTYEEEQKEINEKVISYSKQLQECSLKQHNTKEFLQLVRKYTHITELTPELLNMAIDKIIIHEDLSSGKKKKEIEIIYNFIGEFSL